MYIKETLQGRYRSHVSTNFNAQNGVKQGGVLSPIIFSVYTDDSFTWLKNSGMGYITSRYTGGLTLLLPSNKGLQWMVYIYYDYTIQHDVTFNVKS